MTAAELSAKAIELDRGGSTDEALDLLIEQIQDSLDSGAADECAELGNQFLAAGASIQLLVSFLSFTIARRRLWNGALKLTRADVCRRIRQLEPARAERLLDRLGNESPDAEESIHALLGLAPISPQVDDLKRRLTIAEAVCEAALEAREGGMFLPDAAHAALDGWVAAEGKRVAESFVGMKQSLASVGDEPARAGREGAK